MATPHDARELGAPDFTFSAESRWQTIRENLSILLAPVRYVAQPGGRRPFEIASLWRRPEALGRAQWLSLALHGLLITTLTVSFVHTVTQPPNPILESHPWKDFKFPGYKPEKSAQRAGGKLGSGGGGDRSPLPATLGKLPDFSQIQLAPPSLRQNDNAILRVKPTLIGPNVPAPSLPYPNFGDPTALGFTNSQGRGGGDGFGGDGIGGVGPRGNKRGAGPGDDNSGTAFREGGKEGTSYPQCIYCPNPTFSDDARKAKVQGRVELQVVVTPDGRATNIQVIRGLGLGLDERAVEAVRNWRFRPSRDAAGRATPVWITIEVTFRLL